MRALGKATRGVLLAIVGIASLAACDNTPPTQTKSKLIELETRLKEADKTGDASLALKGITAANDLVAGLNDRPDSPRACVLAAVYLSDGYVRVMQGDRWSQRDRYDENMRMCK
ncbi:hypothetical protein [Variovorax paradoxus]|jgi:type IV pilus biogenesis protein CpaD/CtpE|uniref:hypothetical protein n=1 Tax=Variovorax paradoxus TaxID=34073 RepID=UPI000AC93771